MLKLTLSVVGPWDWSLTSLKEKLIKIGAKVVSHGRYVAFQLAEVAIHRKCSRRFAADRGTTTAAATSAQRETPDGHAFRSNDGRSVSKCSGKWRDQAVKRHSGRPRS